jgi:ribosomal protein L25 (general stress protein Ctc)
VDTKESPVQFSLKQVEMKDVVVHQPETAPIEVKMSGQESLMLVYMRVKIAAMVLCTGAVAGLAAVLATRLL